MMGYAEARLLEGAPVLCSSGVVQPSLRCFLRSKLHFRGLQRQTKPRQPHWPVPTTTDKPCTQSNGTVIGVC